MPAARPIKTNFTGGEFSPRLAGRVDLERYGNAAKALRNVLVQAQGGATRRPGSYHAATTKTAGKRVRLVPFQVSTTAAYVCEFGEGYIRFYNNRGRLESGGSPVEVAAPYTEAQLRELRFAQSADVLYITHKDHQPRKLSRTSATSFTIDTVTFRDGPYQPVDITGATLTPSAVGGTITVTSLAAVFSSSDVGKLLAIRDEAQNRQANTAYTLGSVWYADDRGVVRLYRVVQAGTTAAANMAGTTPNYDLNMPKEEGDAVRDGTAILRYLGRGKAGWGWGTITAVAVGGLSATVEVLTDNTLSNHSVAAREWRKGEWGGDRGWPRSVAFYQGRTVWGGSIARPQTIWFSEVSDYEKMSPSEPDNAVLDTNAVTITMDDGEVQAVRWLTSTQRGIVVGTPSAIFTVAPANGNSAFSPTNVRADRREDTGSSDLVAGFREQGVVLFLESGDRKMREFTYDFATDAFSANDLTILSEHITGIGVVEAAFQRRPDRVLWAVRTDGTLLSLTYDREQQVRAWCQHTLGGGGVVESVAVVPGPDGRTDDVYVSVLRGSTRTVEWIRPAFDSTRDGGDAAAYFVDGGLTYSGAPATTFTGLAHLNGATVQIMGDGADRGTAVVSGGSVTIPAPAVSTAHIGYAYTSRIELLPWEAGTAGGSAQGQPQRQAETVIRLHQTGGLSVGRDGAMETLSFREPGHAMDTGSPLFTGDRRLTPNLGWARSGPTMVLESVAGLPMTVLAVIAEVNASG